MKRIFALMLCLFLVVSMAAPVFADEQTFTITINGTHTGHTYEAYQIFKGSVANLEVPNQDTESGGTQDGTSGQGSSTDEFIGHVEWGTGVNPETFLAALKADNKRIVNPADETDVYVFSEKFQYATTAQDVATIMSGWGNNMDRINHFAKILGNHLTNTSVSSTSEEDSTTYTIAGLESGYYLVKDQDKSMAGDAHDYYTKFIVTLTTSTTVNVKGSVPTVDKKVSETLVDGYGTEITNHLNRIHYYELVGTITPDINDYDYYQYGFIDTLDPGLTFRQIEEIYIMTNGPRKDTIYSRTGGANGGEFKHDVWYPDGEKDKVETPTVANGNKLTVMWNDLLASYPNLLGGDTVHVKYSAMLNEDAIYVEDGVDNGTDGTENSVVLKYGNNPYVHEDFGQTPPAKTRVYNFALELLKYDQADQKPLSGAQFKLSHMHTENDGNVEHFAVVKDGKIVNWLTQAQSDLASEEDKISILTSGPDGMIKLSGLKDKVDYRLTEVQAPAGYSPLLGQVHFQITDYTADANGNITYLKYEANNKTVEVKAEDGKPMKVNLAIDNKRGNTLPSTGGMGTTILYAAGGILVVAAIVLLVTKKRMEHVE